MTTEPADVLLVTGIGELNTGAPNAEGPVRDAAVLSRGGTISWVGPASSMPLELSRQATVTVDAGGAAVVPGLIDCHTHLVFAGSRAAEFAARVGPDDYAEAGEDGGGIGATIRATEVATDEQLVVAAVDRANQALSNGTTTIEVKTGYGRTPTGELRLLGLAAEVGRRTSAEVIPTYLPLHRRPAPGDAARELEAARDSLPAAAGRAAFCDVFCDPAGWDLDSCRELLVAAAALGFQLKVHAEQTAHAGGAALAAELGARSADHLEYANSADARALAGAGVVGVLLPGATLSLRARPPDARMLAKNGVRLAIATDCNPGTSNTNDMRLVIALAVGLLGLTTEEALGAATTGAAAALGLVDRGVLAPGMRCDLVILDAESHVDIAYRLGAVPVTEVVVAGRPVSSSTGR